MIKKSWYYVKSKEKIGPVSDDTIKELIIAKALPQETLVWTKGIPNWTPAKELKVFSIESISNEPPPIPQAHKDIDSNTSNNGQSNSSDFQIPSQSIENSIKKPKGLGGWLILPALGLIFFPIRNLLYLYRDFFPYFKKVTGKF